MRRIALVFAFALLLLGINGCEAGSITYDSGNNTIIVVGFSESSPCTFEDIYQADVANGWGVVSKQGDNQYEFRCKLQIGDGTNETWLIDANKAISHTINDNFIYISNYGHFRCGVVVDEVNRTTKDGCFIYTNSSNMYILRIDNEGTIELYSTTISAPSGTRFLLPGPTQLHKIWNCNIIHVTTFGGPAKVDFYRTNWQGGNGPRFTTVNSRDIRFTDCGIGLYLYNLRNSVTIRDYKMVGEEYSFITGLTEPGADLYAINVDCKWKIMWKYGSRGKIYRQYSFNLKVVDEAGNPINGAKVKVYNKSGKLVLENTTDADGQIPEQIITRGYYDQAHGNTLVDFSPHTLVIEKEGYETYTMQFTPTEAIDWQISLKKVEEGESEERGIIEVKEERKGKSDIGEGLVLGLGFGIVLLAIAFFVMKGGGRE